MLQRSTACGGIAERYTTLLGGRASVEGALCAHEQLASPSQPERNRFAKKLVPGGQFLYVRPPRHDNSMNFDAACEQMSKKAELEQQPKTY